MLLASCSDDGSSAPTSGNNPTSGNDAIIADYTYSDTKGDNPPTLNNTDKASVIDFYNNFYNAGANSENPPLRDSSKCDPNKLSDKIQKNTLNRVNFYRKMVGFDGGIEFKAEYNMKAHKAALIMAANNALTHYPPASYTCYSADGANGASHSNLASGSMNTFAVDGYILDNGAGNQAVGHRRWILSSTASIMGHGALFIPSKDALYVVGTTGGVKSTAQPDFIAWPPAGYLPRPLALNWMGSPSLQRWSFGKPGVDFSTATVAMTKDGAGAVTANIVSSTDNGYGDNTLVWEINDISGEYKDDDRYNIIINGVSGGPYNYWVEIADVN